MWAIPILGLAIALLLSDVAHAYVGPGAGAGVVSVVLGILAAIGLAVVSMVWYPMKRLLGRRKRAEARDRTDEPVHGNESRAS